MATSRSMVWFVWIIASIFYAYQYILRVMPNIIMNDITQQFDINAAIFGQFSGVYYIGYALLHLPIGIMLDRYGPKKIMSACILLTVVGLLPLIYAKNWIFAVMGRALIGVGSSAAILGTFKIIRMTFSDRHFTRMLSLSVTIGLIGAIYGGGPVSYLCSSMGYKAVIKIFAGLGLLLAAITYFSVPEMESHEQSTLIADIKMVFTNSKVIAICCFAGLMVGPLEGFADVWGAEFLKQVYRIDHTTASYLTSMIFIGMCFGAPALSLLAEKTNSYFGSISGAGIFMLLTFIGLLAGILTIKSITIGFIIVGVCCAYQILAIYKASVYVPEHVAGLTTAVANMIIMSFGYAFHSIIGLVINAHGGIQVAQAFVYGVGIIPLTLSVGVLGFLIIAYQENNRFKKLGLSSKDV